MIIKMPENKIDGFSAYKYARLLQKVCKSEYADDSRLKDFDKFATEMSEVMAKKARSYSNEFIQQAVSEAKGQMDAQRELLLSQISKNHSEFRIPTLQALSAASEDLKRKGIFARDKAFVIKGEGKKITADEIMKVADEVTSNSKVFEVSEYFDGTCKVSFPREYYCQEDAFLLLKELADNSGFSATIAKSYDGRDFEGDFGDLLLYSNLGKARSSQNLPMHESIFGDNVVSFHFDKYDAHMYLASVDFIESSQEQLINVDAFVEENSQEYEVLYQKWVSTAYEGDMESSFSI